LFIITTGFSAWSDSFAIACATRPTPTVVDVIAGTPTCVVVDTVPQALIAAISSSAAFFAI
jgi:hypothetical protein